MTRRPFNLTFLRRGAMRTPPATSTGVTRREAIAGVAAAAVVPRFFSSFAGTPSVVGVTASPGRAALTLDGVEAWSIDASRYGGRPRVAVTRSDNETEIRLAGALYPGTSLPADLTIVSYGGVTGPRIHISLSLGGFEAEVPARAWLSRRASASARVALSGSGLSGRLTLDLTGQGEAAYDAAGSLRVSGSGIASLGGLTGSRLLADTVEVKLLDPSAPSSLSRPPARRTLLTLERGEQRWAGAPRLSESHAGSLAWTRDAFDAVDLEAALSAAGTRLVAVARSSSDATAVTYRTAAPGGGTIELPLASPRLAVSYDSGVKSTALVAEFAAHSWIPLKGLSVRVGPADGAPPFEASGTGHRLTTVTCSPAITGVVPATTDGTIVEAVLHNGKATRLASLGDVRVPVGLRKSSTFALNDVPVLPASDLVVVRPDDLLVLTLRFENLYVDSSGDVPVLRPASLNAPSYLIAELPPQHVLERAFYQTRPDTGAKIVNKGAMGQTLPTNPTGSEPLLGRPVKALLSGGSRLAFKVPVSIDPIEFTLDGDKGLLRFDRLEPSIVDAARVFQPGSGTPISNPAPVDAAAENQTSIEFPTRLFLSPDEMATWINATSPVIAADPKGGPARWSELWHTVAVPENLPWSADRPTPLRAVYSPDYSSGTAPTHNNSPFRAPLDRRDRHELVKIMGRYRFDPAVARLFALSALGGWVDLKATWDPTSYTSLSAMSDVEVEAWEHRATQGRDHYVKVVYSGYLFPFGHRASLIKVTERQYRLDPTSPASPGTAYLIQRMYVVVREPVRDYGETTTARSRQVPFRTVRIETARTPDLDNIGSGIGGKGQQSFWPKVGGTEFAFRMTATDRVGRSVEFTAPLIFVSRQWALYTAGSPLGNASVRNQLIKVLTDYRDAAHPLRRGRVFGGQPVAYALESGSRPGDTTLETTGMSFTAEVFPATEADSTSSPRFSPKLDYATVRVPAVGEITGGKPAAFVRYPVVYLNNGLADSSDLNTGDVFIELLPTAQVPVPFSGDRAGGLATPSFTVSALSRTYGTVSGDVSTFAKGTFDAGGFFDPSANLLGGITLGDVVAIPDFKTVGGTAAGDIPRMKQYVDGDEQVVSYEWTTGSLEPIAVFQPGTDCRLSLRAEARRKLPPANGEPTISVTGDLYDFTILLVHPLATFIAIKFDSIGFKSLQGATPTVNVNIPDGGVEFRSVLVFLNAFTPFISFGGAGGGAAALGGGSGADIAVDATGVTLKYTLAIPTIALGMWSIQDIAFSAGIRLPFDGSPVRLRLAFSDREKPFLIGVLCFAGGGFFAISLGADSIESLEASLEFGGQLSLSLGVASGAVYARGGIYFGLKYLADGKELTFSAFLRMGGALEVLGIITISMEFYMALNYTELTIGGVKKVKLWGEATLTVEVEVLCFSKSVDVTVTRELAGSDPGFIDMFPPDNPRDPVSSSVWETYCAAFEPALLK